MMKRLYTSDDIQPGENTAGASTDPKQPAFTYPTQDDYTEALSDDDLIKTISKGAQPKTETKEEPQQKWENTYQPGTPPPTPPPGPAPTPEQQDKLDADKRRAERFNRRLKKASDLAPKFINFLHRDFAIPAHKEIVLKKYTPQEVEQYHTAMQDIQDMKEHIRWTPGAKSIQRELLDYKQRAELDEQDQQDISDDVADIIEYYKKDNVQINPWLMLGFTLVMVSGPVVAPIIIPKVKQWIGGGDDQAALQPKQEKPQEV